MPRKKNRSFRSRTKTRIKNLAPVIKNLRIGLREDARLVFDLALKGANVLDWLAQQKRPKQRKREARKAAQPSHLPIEPGDLPRRYRKPYRGGNLLTLDHIPLEERDLARLELLRASHEGSDAFVIKREELMQRFKIGHLPNRRRIMGAFWSHLSGHRRRGFIARVLAMESGSQGREILDELAKLYRTPKNKLLMEVEASPTLH